MRRQKSLKTPEKSAGSPGQIFRWEEISRGDERKERIRMKRERRTGHSGL